jgi:hypothetical protein
MSVATQPFPNSSSPGRRPSESDTQGRSPDLDSIHSDSPLQSPPRRPTYPPLPSHSFPLDDRARSGRQIRTQGEGDLSGSLRGYDAERAQSMPMPGENITGHYHGSHTGRNGSWDLLGGIRKFEHSYEEFKASNASEPYLAFAEGDLPTNKVRNIYTDYHRKEG